MILYAQGPVFGVADSLDCLVVEIDVSDLDVRVKTFRIQCEAVILCRDLYTARVVVEHRLVGTTVSEFQLENLTVQRKSQQLVAQADPKDGLSAQ